jgi:hypothetical protein
MSKTICSTIRRQVDEMTFEDPQNPVISRHLSECHSCRDFYEKQTKLRQIVGSLGTVSAPPDFDFRLRAKLASGKSNGSYQRTRTLWALGQRAGAVAVAVGMVVGTVILVRQLQNRITPTEAVVEDNKPPSRTVPAGAPSVDPKVVQTKGTDLTARVGTDKEKERVSKRNMSTTVRAIRTLDSEDQALSRATVIRAPQTSDQVFPVDASQQSLKVSLFDGRGNPRTISLPTVTFGSQRVVPTATSFAPKGVW